VKAGGALLAVIGGILALIGFIWGWVVGYYPNELPVIFVLLAIGAGLLWLGSKLYSSAPDTPAAKPYAAQTASTHWLAASAPTEVPVTPQAAIDSTTSAGTLAALAADPRLWSQIEAHPNAYPALLDWIRAQRADADRGEAADTGESDVVARASDPATPPSELAELAQQRPELRAAIAANPAAYPALREWIAQNEAQ